MNKWAEIQVVVLLSMLSNRNKMQHVVAEKLRLIPKMWFHGTKEYLDHVLRPLLTWRELSFLERQFESIDEFDEFQQHGYENIIVGQAESPQDLKQNAGSHDDSQWPYNAITHSTQSNLSCCD
ncbi:hypothetical protein FOTG_05262 [Fusarium oxysporum f. sp. vasinfectum 25433]|uniref:Uncharacterized protein n=1 Tax=Fusarium oxysporum f. sp. vasinfectum 25433 TaxID=1089449 RepID=X0LSQ4_FUSOX|nr:hypothetical protein FOTG_05262 [Fusarium oxysporum f. sp. vasinfectum 25433]KAK2699563.1 hypothetical protein QWA68_002088 [Fusarium oxysporum]